MKTVCIRLLFSLLVAVAVPGCGSSTRHVEVTHSEVHPGGEVERVEKVERVEEHDDDGGGGILSGTIDLLGEIIALPFRAVGALFRAIF